jgi:hypothetical protein
VLGVFGFLGPYVKLEELAIWAQDTATMTVFAGFCWIRYTAEIFLGDALSITFL